MAKWAFIDPEHLVSDPDLVTMVSESQALETALEGMGVQDSGWAALAVRDSALNRQIQNKLEILQEGKL